VTGELVVLGGRIRDDITSFLSLKAIVREKCLCQHSWVGSVRVQIAVRTSADSLHWRHTQNFCFGIKRFEDRRLSHVVVEIVHFGK
jgi:hypothetical protein